MQQVINERDQALEDLQSVETAFSDLHRRYEKTKAVVEGFKKVHHCIVITKHRNHCSLQSFLLNLKTKVIVAF